MRPIPGLALLLSLASALGAAQQVEVVTHDGQRIRGELVAQDQNSVTVSVVTPTKSGGTMKGHMPIARDRIKELVELPPPAVQYKQKLAAAGETAAEQLDLARWCRDNGLEAESLKHAKRAGELAPDDPATGKLLNQLGYWRHQGAWMTEAEYAQATGEIKYRDRFVGKDEYAKLVEQDQAAAAQREKEQAAAQSKTRVAVAETRIASLTREIERLDKEKADLEGKIPGWEQQTKQVEAKQKDVDRLEERVREAGRRNNNNNNNNRNGGYTVNRELEEAQKQLNAARRELAAIQNQAYTARSSLSSAKSRLGQIEASRKRAEQSKTQAEQELAAAKQAAAAAEQAAKDGGATPAK